MVKFKSGGLFGSAVAVFVVLAGLGIEPAQAMSVTCPDPLAAGQDRQYSVDPAKDCVTFEGNIGQGSGDAITDNLTFGLDWDLIKSSENAELTVLNDFGLIITNITSNTFSWSLTNTDYEEYALGLVDGGNPKSAVFWLDGTSGTASITTQQGAWSHVVLYGSGDGGGDDDEDDDDEIPEPATLALVGLSLVGLAASRRRKRL